MYLFFIIFLSLVSAHKIEYVPIILTQPNGEQIQCYSSGDQYYHWVHDAKGYTIVQHENNGYYYYAIKDENDIIASDYIVGSVNPSDVGINKNIIIDKEKYLRIRNSYWNDLDRRDAPSIGTLNNINIFIRFADEFEFPNSRNFYDAPFNEEDGPSMMHYFKEVSYDLLTVNTVHYPTTTTSENVSYQDQHPRSYYQPFNQITNPNGYQNDNQARIREHDLLRDAVNFVESQIPENLDIDANDDGYVDSVTFLVRGSPGAWASLLWPHMWVLYTHNVYINGARVYDYNFNLEQGGYFTVGTLCHEFFHTLGAPDLYHYWDDVAPVAVGGWDVMDQSSNIPQSMSAYMKYKYTDWINELPVLNYGGTYEVSPISNPYNNIFRLNSPASSNEFFVLEYRVKEGIYEINTPGGQDGLVIYRVDENLNGNANGPPDELYVYRYDGTNTSNGNFAGAIFNENLGTTKFNDNTNPSSFLADGSPGGINISNIGLPEETIRFDIVNMILLPEIESLVSDEDNDNVINPGEEVILNLSISNLSSLDAQNVYAVINNNNSMIEIDNNNITFGNILNNNNSVNEIVLNISENAMGDIPIDINVYSTYVENGQTLNYEDNFKLILNVSLYQQGFPYSTLNEIHSSPVVSDLDLNGEKELIFGDHFGVIHAINYKGNNILSNIFPYDTEDQIWASPVLSDIDLDGFDDLIVASKSNQIFVFDYTGLKWTYNANTQLIGTPAIGNFNNTPEKEIVIAGYSSNANNYLVLSHLGELISNLEIQEKNKSGFAIHDFNQDNLDEIIFGTDDNNIFLINNDMVSEGFPFEGEDKFKLLPAILKLPNKNLILFASKNRTLYALNELGNQEFSKTFEENISTAISILEYNDTPMIVLGFNNGDIKGVNIYGDEILSLNINSRVVGSIVFDDLNNDGYPEIIAANSIGELHVKNFDGNDYNNFPINFSFPFSSSPMVSDLDNDIDKEIVIGTTNSIIVIDIKETSSNSNYWNMYGKDNERRNFHEFSSVCNLGDLDYNGVVNILDVINLINIVLGLVEYDDGFICLADFNSDNQLSIQDIVLIIDFIFNEI